MRLSQGSFNDDSPSPATVVRHRVIRYIGFLIDQQYGCKNFYAECNINTCPSIYFGMNG